MTHDLISNMVAPGVFVILGSCFFWALKQKIQQLNAAVSLLKNHEILITKFDQATKLIGDLSGLQEQLAECKSGLHNTMFYVKKLRSEFQVQHRRMSELLARLDKLEGELRSTSGEIKENVTKAYKVMQYYDVSLSPRAPFPFGDEDGGSGGSGQQLLPANLL